MTLSLRRDGPSSRRPSASTRPLLRRGSARRGAARACRDRAPAPSRLRLPRSRARSRGRLRRRSPALWGDRAASMAARQSFPRHAGPLGQSWQAHPDARICVGVPEAGFQPFTEALEQLHRRKCAYPVHVVVDHDEDPARLQGTGVMGDHVCGVGQVKQQESAGDGVELRVVHIGAHIALTERDVGQACLHPSLLGDGQLRRVAVDAGDRPVSTN